MSQENVEIVRGWIDACNRDGLDEAARFLDPEIEWTTTSAYLEAGTYHGHDGVRHYLRRATAGWEDLQIEPERIIDAVDQVVVPLRVEGRGRQTGTPTGLSFTVLVEVQHGMIVRMRNYTSEAEALDAAGLGGSTEG